MCGSAGGVQAAEEARVCLTEDPRDAVSRARLATAMLHVGAYRTAVELLQDDPQVLRQRHLPQVCE